MNKINFFFKSFNGKGWFIPLKGILKGTEFYSQAVSLGEMNIFNLGDIAKLINNQKLSNSLSSLDLEERKIIDFESYLTKKVEDLKVFNRTQKWIIPGTLIFGVFVYIISSFLLDQKDGYSSDKKESRSNYSYESSPSVSKQKVYQVANQNYAFAKTEAGFERLMEAVRLNDLRTISLMRVNGTIKSFPAGKQVNLINQGFSIIKIMDPDTGIYYYGATESIK